MSFDRKGFYREVGILLNKYRTGANITQEELAEVLEMPRATYANIERGRQRAPADVIWRISVYLDVPITRLLPEPLLSDTSDLPLGTTRSSTHDPLIGASLRRSDL